jgi:hypothetical protein
VRRHRYAMATKQVSDRGRRDHIAECEQLAANAYVAPARVLLGQTQDQLPALLR